jgi:hypothetical protein
MEVTLRIDVMRHVAVQALNEVLPKWIRNNVDAKTKETRELELIVDDDGEEKKWKSHYASTL